MEWMILPLKRYADFSGRSRRKEYCLFFLLMLVVSLAAGVIDTLLGFGYWSHGTWPNGNSYGWGIHNGPLGILLILATIIPSIAVTARRFHDQDKSGWWMLVMLVPFLGWIVLLVFMTVEGTRGTNRYGPDPLAASSPDAPETFR